MQYLLTEASIREEVLVQYLLTEASIREEVLVQYLPNRGHT